MTAAVAHRHNARLPPHQNRLIAALLITILFFAVEVIGGQLAGSLALLSDAGHMLADIFALLLSLVGLKLASRPATPDKAYGYYRLEILCALANGVLLSLVALYIFIEAWQHFFDPRPIRTGVMMSVAAVGLGANLLAAAILHGSSGNLSVRSAYLHVVGDALSSLGVVVGGGAILLTGESRIDPLVGAGIGAIVLRNAFRIVREAADVLLEASPRGIAAADVSQVILAAEGVVGLHDLHIWSLTTGVEALSAHVLVCPADLARTDRILTEINSALLARFRIAHTTIQVESEDHVHAGCTVNG